MLSYLVRRTLMLVPVFLAVSVVIFSILHFIPGDPIDNLLKPGSSPTARAEMEAGYGLDRPLPVLLYYLTAKADEQGAVSFRPDVYGRDQRLQELFAEPVLSARIAFEPPVTAPPPGVEPADEEDADRPLQANTESQNGVRLTRTDG